MARVKEFLDALLGIVTLFGAVMLAGALVGTFVFGCQSIASLAPVPPR